jgi:hypothetical protein
LGFVLFGKLTRVRLPYAISVRQTGTLPPTSFGFHLAVDTLVFG